MIQPHLWMTIYEFHFTDAEKANGSDATIVAFLDRQLKVDQSHSHAVEFIMSTELKINVHEYNDRLFLPGISSKRVTALKGRVRLSPR